MSTVGETPPDGDPGIMANEKLVAVNCGQEASDVDTEPAMLDEEEMPSYVSLASLQVPEDSKTERVEAEPVATAEDAAEQAPSEHGADSVCVLSSGEESDRRTFEAMEDYDSEEMDMEEEEDEESCMNEEEEEEEDSDGDIEPEQFERSSDDFVLRYDSGLEKHHKERSRSLQDLTNSSRGNLSRFVGKRRSIDHMGGNLEPEFSCDFGTPEDPLDVRKKSRSHKYGHVTSKVKLYIQEMKEQRRRSAERASGQIPCQRTKEENSTTSAPENLKRIKSYVRNTINEMKSNVPSDRSDNQIKVDPTMSNETNTETFSRSNESPENLAKKPRMALKTNGLADHVTRSEETLRLPEINGPQENTGIFDLRSMTYEEYTNGEETVKNSNRPNRIQDKTDINEKVSQGQKVTEGNRAPADLREPEESSRRKVILVDSEVYQKILEENAALKRELEETRKSLERSRIEVRELEEAKKKFELQIETNAPPETSVASVQTEKIEEKNQAKMDTEETQEKLLSSTVTSAQSSMEQWSDSNCSPAISIDPPNIEAALNVDDSLAHTERIRKSSSFVAGSRILQTLDNITRGQMKTREWTKVDDGATRNSSNEQGQSKRQTLEASNPGNSNYSKSRKRCAADMLGQSNNSESFKIPFVPVAGIDTRRKMNSASAVDPTIKNPNETRQAEIKINDNGQPRIDEDNDDNYQQDNVRFIVYEEEPDSKQRSFLIQADDPTANEDNDDKGQKPRRECGPFLLGNVEIRMTEVNGTLNIWGKEVGESFQEEEVAMETEESVVHERSSFMPRAPFACQSTPHPKCSHVSTTQASCSRTGPSEEASKLRISPRFGRSAIGKYFRSAASNFSRNNATLETNNCACSSHSLRKENERGGCCERFENNRQKRTKLINCDHHKSHVNQHSCCLHNSKIETDLNFDDEVFDDSTVYGAISNILACQEKYNAINATSKQTCPNIRNNETSGNRTYCRHLSIGRQDNQTIHHTKNRCSSCNAADSCDRVRLSPNTCHSQNFGFCDDEAHPLLSSNTPCETPETKRRRLSGKKVRGIITDLLRGCSGCREANSTSSLPKANLQNVITKMHLSPCSSSEGKCRQLTQSCPSHLNHSSNEVTNERCCNACTRRAEMRAEIENQLEVFRVSIEQLRSRSITVLEMLHLLKAETD